MVWGFPAPWCPIAGWFISWTIHDNPMKIHDFMGTQIVAGQLHHRFNIGSPSWSKVDLRKMPFFPAPSYALSGLLRHATNACCSRWREPFVPSRVSVKQEHQASCLWINFIDWDNETRRKIKKIHQQAIAGRCAHIWVCSHNSRKTDWKAWCLSSPLSKNYSRTVEKRIGRPGAYPHRSVRTTVEQWKNGLEGLVPFLTAQCHLDHPRVLDPSRRKGFFSTTANPRVRRFQPRSWAIRKATSQRKLRWSSRNLLGLLSLPTSTQGNEGERRPALGRRWGPGRPWGWWWWLGISDRPSI